MKRALVFSLFSMLATVGMSAVVINEVDYDQAGTDNAGEFVELYNNGGAAVDISGWKLELLNGSSGTGTVYTTVTFPGAAGSNTTVIAAGGYYVIGDSDMANEDQAFAGTQDLIQNGAADGIRLKDSSDVVQDALAYEMGGTVSYTGPADSFEGSQFKGQDRSFGVTAPATPGVAISIGRCPDGADTNDNSADFHLMPASPKASNTTASTLPLPYSNDFGVAGPVTGTGIYDSYIQAYAVALPAGTVPVSPDPTSPASALKIADATGGGDHTWFGGAGNTGNINVEGFWYLKSAVTGGMTFETSGFDLRNTKQQFFYSASRSTSNSEGYEDSLSVIYTAGTMGTSMQGVSQASGSVLVDQHIGNPESDTPVASSAMAGGWVAFRAFLDHTNNRFYVKVGSTIVYDGVIPAGTPTKGGITLGYRQSGGTFGADNAGFFDALTINTDTSTVPPASVNEWMMY